MVEQISCLFSEKITVTIGHDGQIHETLYSIFHQNNTS